MSGEVPQKYREYFNIADRDGDSTVGSQDAVLFYQRFGIKSDLLAKIWSLCDTENQGFLNQQAFFNSLKLIALAQNGIDPSAEALNRNEWPIPKVREFDWTLQPLEISSYEKYFEQTDTDQDGFIDTEQGKALLLNSGLPTNELAVIWELSDFDKDNKLNKKEYVVALQLVAKRKQGVPLPQTLPQPLLAYLTSSQQTPQPELSNEQPTQNQQVQQNQNAQQNQQNQNAQQNQQQDSNLELTEHERQFFDNIFKQADPQNTGFVNGPQAKQLFEKSNLDNELIQKIATLTDLDGDGKYNRTEFILAMYLISVRMRGIQVPDNLSERLIQSATFPEERAQQTQETNPTQSTQEIQSVQPTQEIKPTAETNNNLLLNFDETPAQNSQPVQTNSLQMNESNKKDEFADFSSMKSKSSLYNSAKFTTTTHQNG